MALDETPGSITEPQAKYIDGLVKKKDLSGNARYTPTPEQRAWLEAGNYSSMSKAQASKAIKLLLELNDKPVEPVDDEVPTEGDIEGAGTDADGMYVPPVRPLETSDPRSHEPQRSVSTENEVDAGFYFIVDPKDGEEKFFKVSKGAEGGRWEGRTFLEVRGGDFFYSCKSPEYRERIYAEILKDPITAMNEYGMRLGECGMCGRTLTARDSRLRGIGPICAARIMMQESQATPDQLDMLTKLGIRKG